MKRTILTAAILLVMIFAMGATFDRRSDANFPVARVEFTRLTWTNGGGHAAQTATVNANGIVYRCDIIISGVTANPTTDVSFTDQNGAVPITAFSALADNTKWVKNALVNSILVSADFNPI